MRSISLLFVLLVATALAACGSDEQETAGSDSGAQSEDAAFPVSIAHKYGTTKIDTAPKRVVVVGLREQDALLALGVVPVATTEWYEQSGRDLPVGQGRARRRQGADGPQQHRRHRGREGGRTAARPHPRDLLRDDREGVQLAVEDRPDRRPAQGGARLRVLVAGGDADHRRGRRQAGGGAQARGRHREARGRHRGQVPQAQRQHGRDRGRLSGHLRLRDPRTSARGC